MRQIGKETNIPAITMETASFPSPFVSGLEYSVPARGGWTIVQMGYLIPEVHEIFVCAAGCLRGVVLSAAEMNVLPRFSTISIEEQNVLNGDLETLLIDGVTDILNRLPEKPKAVLVYSSCIHHFVGCDLPMCYRILQERFPAIDFADCYMIPTMRKSGLTPDQIMQRQIYSLLKPVKKEEKHCAIVGNCFAMKEYSDLVSLISDAGWTLHQIMDCQTYEEYQSMAACTLCINTNPIATAGAEALAKRLNMTHLYLPANFGADETTAHLETLASVLGVPYSNSADAMKKTKAALNRALNVIGDTPIVIDALFTPRPLGLARLLLSQGFSVTELFLDGFNKEEKTDYLWLREHAPKLILHPTVHASMRTYPRSGTEKVLALGQKAAFFTDSPYFVNLVDGGGLYGFAGIRRLADLMVEACLTPKDTERLLSMKCLECESCL